MGGCSQVTTEKAFVIEGREAERLYWNGLECCNHFRVGLSSMTTVNLILCTFGMSAT